MKQKINDIVRDKEKDINLSRFYPLTILKAIQTNTKKTTQDLYKKCKEINLSLKKSIELIKNKTENFDALKKKGLKNPLTIKKRKNNFLEEYIFYSFEKIGKWIKKKAKNTTPKKSFIFISILACIFFVYIGLSKFVVENRMNSGFETLLSIKEEGFNDTLIKEKIYDADLDFKIATLFFMPFEIFPTKNVRDAHHIISGSRSLTKTLRDAFELYEETENFMQEKWLQEIYFSQLFENISPHIFEIINDIKKVHKNFSQVKDLANKEIQEKIDIQTKNLESFIAYLDTFEKDFQVFLDILGHNEEKKYLFIFQNADEIRPTGGFMGSMGIVSLFRGKVKDFDKRDVYAYEWDLKKADLEKELPPEGINKITDSFGLRDANYFINTKDSAEKIRYFIENAGYDIDGIVFLNQNIILDFLNVIDGVYEEDLETTITGKNFSPLMSLLVEAKVSKEGSLGTPKQVLFDFMDGFLEKIASEKKYSEYLDIVMRNIKNREIIFYNFDEQENNFLSSFGLNGWFTLPDSLDYSFPIFTSISGNKSDRYIQRSFTKKLSFNEDCSVDTTLSITLKHTFSAKEKEFLSWLMEKYGIEKTSALYSIQGEWKNNQYVRLLLPKEAQIKDQKWLIIQETPTKKIVSFYMTTEKTQVNTMDISYHLPNSTCQSYDFTFLKQAGIPDYDIDFIEGDIYIKKRDINTDFYYNERGEG